MAPQPASPTVPAPAAGATEAAEQVGEIAVREPLGDAVGLLLAEVAVGDRGAELLGHGSVEGRVDLLGAHAELLGEGRQEGLGAVLPTVRLR